MAFFFWLLANETNLTKVTKVDSMEMLIFFVPYLVMKEIEVLPFLVDENLELDVIKVMKETEVSNKFFPILVYEELEVTKVTEKNQTDLYTPPPPPAKRSFRGYTVFSMSVILSF